MEESKNELEESWNAPPDTHGMVCTKEQACA